MKNLASMTLVAFICLVLTSCTEGGSPDANLLTAISGGTVNESNLEGIWTNEKAGSEDLKVMVLAKQTTNYLLMNGSLGNGEKVFGSLSLGEATSTTKAGLSTSTTGGSATDSTGLTTTTVATSTNASRSATLEIKDLATAGQKLSAKSTGTMTIASNCAKMQIKVNDGSTIEYTSSKTSCGKSELSPTSEETSSGTDAGVDATDSGVVQPTEYTVTYNATLVSAGTECDNDVPLLPQLGMGKLGECNTDANNFMLGNPSFYKMPSGSVSIAITGGYASQPSCTVSLTNTTKGLLCNQGETFTLNVDCSDGCKFKIDVISIK